MLLARRSVRLYLAGESVSMFGDTALWLAMGVWVKSLTGSSSAAGLVFFAFGLPQLASPLSGLLADRVRRRPLLLVTNVATAGVVLLLLLVHGRSQVWMIYAVMVAYGASYTVLSAAQSALLTTLVPAELLGDANGLLSTVRQGLRLVAPLTGAALFSAAGPRPVIALDASTFLVAALSLLLLRLDEPAPQPHETHWRAQASAGLHHVVRTPPLRRVVLASSLAMLVIGSYESAAFAVVDQGLHKPPSFIGIIVSAQGVGAICSGVLSAAVMRRTGEGLLVAMGLGAIGVGAALGVSTSVGVVLTGAVVLGGGLPWFAVGVATLLQRRTPPELQGRVSAAADLLLGAPQLASIALGALLLGVVSYRVVLLAIGAVVSVAAAFVAADGFGGLNERHSGATGVESATEREAVSTPRR